MDVNPSSPETPQDPELNLPRKVHKRRNSTWKHQDLVWETVLKLSGHLLLAGGMGFALLQLWPHHQAQQQNLRQVKSTLQQAEINVQELRADFSRYFDASQAHTVMQEQSGRVTPQQRPIILLD